MLSQSCDDGIYSCDLDVSCCNVEVIDVHFYGLGEYEGEEVGTAVVYATHNHGMVDHNGPSSDHVGVGVGGHMDPLVYAFVLGRHEIF